MSGHDLYTAFFAIQMFCVVVGIAGVLTMRSGNKRS